MQRSIRRFSFLNDLWDSIDIIEVEERKMKKLVLTMLSIAGMMLFTALPAKACTSYYVGKDCTKDGTTMYGRTEDISSRKDKVYKVIQAKHVGKNAVYKDESGATEFQAPIKVDTTYRYTICRDNEEMKMDILENSVQTVKVLQCLQRRQHLLQRVSDSTIHM